MGGKRRTVASTETVSQTAFSGKVSREHLVPAYIIEAPNLALHTSLLNLLWYAVECISSLPSLSAKNARCSEHFLTCVSRLRAITQKDLSSLDERVRSQLSQFLGEAEKAGNLLAGYCDNAKPGHSVSGAVIPQSVAAEIAGYATYLHWLAVCISEELKLPAGNN